MNLFINKISGIFTEIPDMLRHRRVFVWLLFLSVTVVLAAGLPRVKTDGSVLSYFNRNEPVRKAYDQFRAAFGGDENLYIVYEAKDGDVFSNASLQALQGIQEELLNYRLHLEPNEKSPLDHIEDVTTLINISYLESSKDALISRDFIGSPLPRDAQQREHIRQSAFKKKNIPKIFFSEDSKFGGILIETDFNVVPRQNNSIMDTDTIDDIAGEFAEPIEDENPTITAPSPVQFKENVMADYVPFMNEVRKIINKPAYSEHLRFYSVGTPAFMDFVFVMILGEMGMIILGMLALIIIVMGILYRSLSAMLWSVLLVIISLIWTMGTIGWSGVVMPDLIILVVFFIITVCVADIIHLLSGYVFFRQQHQSHPDALRSVFRKSATACLLTSITTAVGFSSMLFVPIVSMQRIGGATAVGIIYAFLITIAILPLMLDIWNPTGRKPRKVEPNQPVKLHLVQRLLRNIETCGFNNAQLTVLLFFAITLAFSFGIKKIRVESSNIDILRPDTTIRKAFDKADEYMAGSDSLEILFDTGKSDGMKDPRILKLMEALQKKLENDFKGSVTTTYSIADVAKDAYRALNNNASKFYSIPDDPGVLSQTLFLFDNADPEDRRELVTDDYRTGRISVFSESLGTMTGIKLMDTVEKFSSEKLRFLQNEYPDAHITLTGMVALRTKMYHFVSKSQITGFGITLCVISVVLFFAFRSAKLGLLALIPNLFPIVAVAGLMGYLKIPLDIHTLLVLPIVIGIAVDDTIHFLSHFQMEYLLNKGDTRIAVIHSYREVGQAILFTTIVLSISFFMFTGSKNMGFVYFGILNAVAIICAVIADLFLLPAILAIHFPSRLTRPAGFVKRVSESSTS